MSGHKRATISISQDEYRRLHEAEMKLRFAPEPAYASARQISHEVNHALQDHLDQLEERQRRFEWSMRDFQQEVRAAELETMQFYLQREEDLYQRLSNASDRRLGEVQALIETQAADFERRLEEERQRGQVELRRLEERLDSALNEQERKILTAENWLAQASELEAFIQQQYAYEMFMPGALERLSRAAAAAEANLADNMPEAALVGGQQAYMGLSELRLQLERLDSEWRLLLETCWEAAARLLAFAEENQVCPAHDLDGNALPYAIDVDFWTGGEMGRQTQDLRELVRDLREDPSAFDLERLRSLAVELPGRFDVLSEIIFQARLAVLNSQLRINIADLVVQALEQLGFGLVESDYQNNDQRLRFSAKVRNRERDEVVIQVSPDPNTLGKNELHLISLDRGRRDERELFGRSEEIAQALDQRGLEVGEIRSNHGRSPGRFPSISERRPARYGRSHIITQ